jgi:hypothetical protein
LPAATPAGTKNFVTNVPVGLITTFSGEVATVILPNLMVACVFLVKLEPVIVTSVPVKPLVGDSVITGPRLTLKVADALLPAASVADIVWLPAVAVLGIVAVAENAPDELVVTVGGVVTSVVLSNFTVIVLLGLKLEPEIVTVVLT